MKIRKLLALTSAIILLCGTFSGCGSSGDDDNDAKNVFNFGGHSDSDSEHEGKSGKKDDFSEKEFEDIPDDEEEFDEMEMYNTAMQFYDTWMTGRLEGDQAKAESVLHPNEEWQFGDDYSPLNEYFNDYQVVQFLVTDISEDIEKYMGENEDDFPVGMEIQKGYQLSSQVLLYEPDGSYDYDSCNDSILEIDGELYFYPDTGFREIEPERIGFSYPTLDLEVDYHEGSSHYDEETGRNVNENYVVLTDGTKIPEDEYDRMYEESLVTEYGYSVEKRPDGTFSFHPIGADGTVEFDDGTTAVVDYSELLFDQSTNNEEVNEQETSKDISSWTDEEVVNAVNKYLEENWVGEYDHYCSTYDMNESGGEFNNQYIWLMIRWNGSNEANAFSGSSVMIDKLTGEAEISYINDPPYEWFNINDYYVG